MMTNLSILRKKHRLLNACAAAALAIAPTALANLAQAQVFFRPYANTFRQPIVEEPAPFGSYRAIAHILARQGFRLVGPLASRGEQVVATGVDAYGRRMRFVIDPYEGQVLHTRPLASARAYEAPGPMDGPSTPEPEPAAPDAEPSVVPGVSEDSEPSAEPRRAERRRPPAPRANAAPQASPQPQRAARPTAPEPVSHAARSDGGSRRAVTPPRPVTGANPPSPSAATPDAKAPNQAAPAAAPAARPNAGAAPPAATPAVVPAAQGAGQGAPTPVVAQPAGAPTAPPAPAATSNGAAPATPDASNDPSPKAQSGVGG